MKHPVLVLIWWLVIWGAATWVSWSHCPSCQQWDPYLQQCVPANDGQSCGDCVVCSGGDCKSVCNACQACSNNVCVSTCPPCQTCDSNGNCVASTSLPCDHDPAIPGADSCYACDHDMDGISESCFTCDENPNIPGADACYTCVENNLSGKPDACKSCDHRDAIPGVDSCKECDLNGDGLPDTCYDVDTDGDGVKDCIAGPVVKTNIISCISYGSLSGRVEAAVALDCFESPAKEKQICFDAEAIIVEPGQYLQLTEYEKCCPPLLGTNGETGTLVYQWSISGPDTKEGSGAQACMTVSQPGEYTATFTISVTNCHCPPPSLVLSTSAVLSRIDLDADANMDGQINTDDEDLEGSPGSLLAVTNACHAQRERIVLQFYGSDGSKPTERPLVLRWPANVVKLYRTASGGAPLAMNDQDNRFKGEQLPVTLWVEGTRPSTSEGDISISLAHDKLGCSDVVVFTAVQLNLFVDSQNRHGITKPQKDRSINKLEAPGKLVPVNRLDWDNDSIPDYADSQVKAAQTLIPLLLEVLPKGLSRESLRIRWVYPGLRDPVDLQNFQPVDILHKRSPSGFKDYRKAKSGGMRLWNLDSPGAERQVDDCVIPQQDYAISELALDEHGERVLWMEGLNPVAERMRAEVRLGGASARLLTCDEVFTTVVEPKLGLNMSGDHADDRMRPGIPDVEFMVDENDEVIKDQRDGFVWWWAMDQFRPISRAGITDVFPLRIEIPPEVGGADLKTCLSVSNYLGAFLYPTASTEADPRAFIKNSEIAEAQLRVEERGETLWGEPHEITLEGPGPRYSKMMKVAGKGVERSTLVLWLKDRGGHFTPVDSWRMTMKEVEYFWTFVSTRGDASGGYKYPTEDGRRCSMRIYPAPRLAPGHPAKRDPRKTQQLVWIHGFNVRLDEARADYNEIFKRLFWLGYRGDFIGLTWDGDVPRGVITDLPLGFDSAVERAFQTSPRVRTLLQALSKGVGAENVNIVAHSLGNLIMFDALRLQAATDRTPIARNAISVQGAVWREAFDPQGGIQYSPPSDPIPYTEDQLMRNSWAFWFNRHDFDPRDALAGRVYHSFSETDLAIVFAMRFNDYIFRGTFDYPGWIIPIPLPGVYGWHYHRDAVESLGEYRAPSGKARLWDRMPALMQPTLRNPLYKQGSLNLPIGAATVNPLSRDLETRNAISLGWRSRQHSDHVAVDKDDDNVWAWFPRVWPWYEQTLGKPSPNIDPAIPLGEE